MLQLILIVAVVLPIAWVWSEAQSRRWISVVLGILSIGVVAFVAYAWAAIHTGFQANTHFGDASKRLAIEMRSQLQAGNREKVIQSLELFVETFHPSYENYPRYSGKIDNLIDSMQTQN